MINAINDMSIRIQPNNGNSNRPNEFMISNEPFIYEFIYNIANGDSEDSITIELTNNSTIKSIDYDITSNSLPTQRWEYSYDGIQFLPLQFFNYISNVNSIEYINLSQSDKDTIDQFQNKTIKLIQSTIVKWNQEDNKFDTIKQITFLVYDLVANKTIEFNQNLNSILNQAFQNTNNMISINYLFNYSENNTTKYIYQNYTIKFLKLNFFNLNITQESFIIKNLNIQVEPILQNNEFKISPYINSIYKQKIFDEYNFIPSITKSFLNLLEQEI